MVARDASLSRGTFERRPHSEHPSPGCQVPCDRPGRSDLSPLLSASPPCSRHTGLLAVPQTCQAGDARDAGLIPGVGRSPEGGRDNPLQYSCLENPMDRGAWWDIVQGVTKESDMT